MIFEAQLDFGHVICRNKENDSVINQVSLAHQDCWQCKGISGNVWHIWQCGACLTMWVIFNNVVYSWQYGLFLRVWAISGNGWSLIFQHRSRSNPACQSNQWAGKKKNNTGASLTLLIPFFASLFDSFFLPSFNSFFLHLFLHFTMIN